MKYVLATLALLILGLGITVVEPTSFVNASAATEICKGAGAPTATGCTGGAVQLQNVVDTIINIFSLVIGIVAVIMIMVGGFKYITANGDSGNISSAKNTIIYAAIGLVITALAQAVVKFVLVKI